MSGLPFSTLQPQRRRTALRLFSWLYVLVAVALVAAASALNEESKAELLYVRGCRDPPSQDARETFGCFAAPSTPDTQVPPASVQLSLQGVHLPTDLSRYRVVLQEHRRPSLTGTQSTAVEYVERMEKVELLCTGPTALPLFPTQLITCNLSNPLISLSDGSRSSEMALSRLLKHSVWFDVRLEIAVGGGNSGAEGYRAESVLRRAVELRVRNPASKADATGDSTSQKSNFSWEDIQQHPLERLYSPASTDKSDQGAMSEDEDGDAAGDELWVELGIGGLKKELHALFRRAFLSRLPSLAPLASALELQHVRGVILYGPPGNGKSLIARSLFRLLGPETRLSVVNAADILSKFVGESEKNLRDAFEGYDLSSGNDGEDDEEEQDEGEGKEKAASHTGRKSRGALQVLVIDEFEALFRRRGHSSDESSAKAVYDGVTNTLLSLMDGVTSRNDLLVVGLTNRLQAVDQALLRPGRFEVLIEIPAPDVPGREDIFFIHTERLREQHFLAPDVDLHALALESGGFSGSDVAGAVRSAVSHALLRYRRHGVFFNVRGGVGSSGEEVGHGVPPTAGGGWWGAGAKNGAATAVSESTFAVTRADFTRAMRDIRSAKDDASALSQLSTDMDDSELEVVDYDGTISSNIDRANAVLHRLLHSARTRTALISITGGPGAGKSTIARAVARAQDFTVVRYVSCRRLSEMAEVEEQLATLRDALSEASHTESGLVVLDDYDLLVDAMSSSKPAAMTLRGLLYEYMHRPGGVSRAMIADSPLAGTGEVGDGAGGGGGVAAEHHHRALLLTSTLASAVQTFSVDAHLRVHPILRSAASTLLQVYRVADKTRARRLAAAYPVSMSFRTFLRVTDIALQRWVEPQMNASATAELPAYFATTGEDRASYEERHTAQVQADFYAASSDAASVRLASAVRATVASMGLMDPYQGWGGEGKDEEDDVQEEGEGKEGVVDIDELVGAADELLW